MACDCDGCHRGYVSFAHFLLYFYLSLKSEEDLSSSSCDVKACFLHVCDKQKALVTGSNAIIIFHNVKL